MAKDDDPIKLDVGAARTFLESLHEMKATAAEIRDIFQSMNDDQKANLNNKQAEIDKLLEQKKIIDSMAGEAAKRGQREKNMEHAADNELKRLKLKADMHRDEQGRLTEMGKQKMREYKEAEVNERKTRRSAYLMTDAAQTLTGVSDDWKHTALGSLFEGDFEQNLIRSAAALKDNFSAANMLGSSLMKVAQATALMVVSADAQFSEVNKLTNSTGEYNDMIMDTMQNNAEWNVSVGDAAEAVKELYTGMSNFTEMSQEAQASVVETTAQLKALGIDASTSAANFEILNAALGMSAEQAANVQKDFAAMAADLGVSAGKIAKDFERNASVFVAYGDQATEVFKEVAAAAKATGIEMEALLGITTQFDTFEGAATAAGKLNAILGGGVLNSMDLLNASEEERVRMLIQSIQLSGKSWESMSKFEKQAIANAAGIKDMTQASKMFGQSLSEYDAAQRKVEDNAEAQKKLEERAAAAANMKEKLTRIMEQFAVAVQPIINAIHIMLDGFLALNDATGGLLVPTLVGLLAVYQLLKVAKMQDIALSAWTAVQSWATAAAKSALASVTGWLTTQQWLQVSSSTAGAASSKLLAKGIKAIGKAATRYLPAIFALGLALMGLALAIAAPLILIAVIIWAIKDVTIAMLEMTDAIGPALLGLMAFIGIVAVGLPIMAAAIVGFFWILTGAIAPIELLTPVLPQMIGALVGIGIGLWILGKAIKQFRDDDMPGAMAVALASLFAFGIGLAIVSIFLKDSAWEVGVAIGILGFGLLLLGKGVATFNDVTWPGIIYMIASLILMGVLLGIAADHMKKPFWKVGLAVAILGFGLLLLGKGVATFNDVTWPAVQMMVASLIALGVMLSVAVKFLEKPAWKVGVAAGILGIGLYLLGKGIQQFMDLGPGLLFGLPIALAFFGLGMAVAGWALQFGAKPFLIGSLFFWPASLIFTSALKFWEWVDPEWLKALGEVMPGFAWNMLKAGIGLAIAGIFFAFGGITVGAGLWALGKGLKEWVDMDIEPGWMFNLAWELFEFGVGLWFAGRMLALAGIPFIFGAVLVGIGLAILNKPLAEFANTLAVLAPIAPQMPAIAHGLWVLGNVLPGFGWGIFKLGIAASMPFFKTGLKTLSKGLKMFGAAMAGIPTEKAVALGHIFQGLSAFTNLKGIGKIMKELADGIWWIAHALSFMPEGEQAVSFSVAAEGLSMLAEASVGVSAESVDNVQRLADAAIDYAVGSRLMRSASEDALVNALKELAGLARNSQNQGQTGQDIVLEIDGDEFARAVDAAIESRHGLKF